MPQKTNPHARLENNIRTQVRRAAGARDRAALERLLRENYTDEEKDVVLRVAVDNAAECCWREGVALLLAVGADAAHINNQALGNIASSGDHEFMRCVLAAGADVRGLAPGEGCYGECNDFPCCCRGSVCCENGIRYLPDRGMFNGPAMSALYCAVDTRDAVMVRLLLEHGANPNTLVYVGDSLESPNCCGATLEWEAEPPLRLAVRNNDIAAARVLLEYGADPLMVTSNSELDEACGVLTYGWMLPILLLLPAIGAPCESQSTLGYAQQLGDREHMVELLEAAAGTPQCAHCCCLRTRPKRVSPKLLANLDAIASAEPRPQTKKKEPPPRETRSPIIIGDIALEGIDETLQTSGKLQDSEKKKKGGKKGKMKSVPSKRSSDVSASSVSASTSSSSASSTSSMSSSTSSKTRSDSDESSSSSGGEAPPSYAAVVSG